METKDHDTSSQYEASLLRAKLDMMNGKLVESSWTLSNCEFMRTMSDKILTDRDLHIEASKLWATFGERYTVIPVLLLNTASGIVNFSVSGNIPQHWNYYIGTFNLVAAMMTSVSQYFRPIEKSEQHLHIARRFGRLLNTLQLELEIPKRERQLYSDCLRTTKTEYDNIKTEAPILPNAAYEQFYNLAKNKMKWNIKSSRMAPKMKNKYVSEPIETDDITIVSHELDDTQ